MENSDNITKTAIIYLNDLLSVQTQKIDSEIYKDVSENDIGSILKNDNLTYHFLRNLILLNSRIFSKQIQNTINWFDNFHEWREERNPNFFSVWKLLSFLYYPEDLRSDEENDYISTSLEKFLKNSFKELPAPLDQQATCDLSLGFVDSFDSGVFPTLVGIEIMRLAKKEWAYEKIKKCLNWALNKSESVPGNKESIYGFLISEIICFQKNFNTDEFSKQLEENINKLVDSWDNDTKIWGNNHYQTFYILSDLLNHKDVLFEIGKIKEIVEESIGKIVDILNDFEINNEVKKSINNNILNEILVSRVLFQYLNVEQKQKVLDNFSSAILESNYMGRKHVNYLVGRISELRRAIPNPFWGEPKDYKEKDKKLCLVIMPFKVKDHYSETSELFDRVKKEYRSTYFPKLITLEDKEKIKKINNIEINFDTCYENTIKPAVTEALLEKYGKKINYKCVRAYEYAYGSDINRVVWNLIYSADIIIADLTIPNPNVYYELGMTHAKIDKNVYLIAQTKEYIPFDLARIGFILYKPGEKDELKKKLVYVFK